jgi:hypothetical protein
MSQTPVKQKKSKAFKPEHRRCPVCDQLMIANRFSFDCEDGCRYWSDGKMDGSMFPATATHYRCPACRESFNMRHAMLVSRDEITAKRISRALILSDDDYRKLAAKAQKSGEVQDEKDVRLAWWHHLNDAIRTGHHRPRPEIDVAWQGGIDENLTRLVELLGERNENDLMFLGEALRELGQFERSLAVLCNAPPKLKWMAGLIGTHAAAGNKELFGILKLETGWLPISPLPISDLSRR